MKITKLAHSCLLVEMPTRTALFDPGSWSESMINVASLKWLDDIIITHEHGDHMHIPTLKALQEKFPSVRIKTTAAATELLKAEGLNAVPDAVEGIELFNAPHEHIEPLGQTPENIGVHYLDMLTHPGDSTHFEETRSILALPVTAPWGSTVQALNRAIELRPKYVIPIHDGQWSDAARQQMYEKIDNAFQKEGIVFYKPVNGEPFNLTV